MDDSDTQSADVGSFNEDTPRTHGANAGNLKENNNVRTSRTSGLDSSSGKKSKRTSKTATKQAELEDRLDKFEVSVNSKFDQILQFFQASQGQNRESLPRSDSSVDNLSSGERRPQDTQGNDSSNGVRRPILSLEPNLDQDLGSPRIDTRDNVNNDMDNRSEISLHVNGDERRLLEIRSDPESDHDDDITTRPVVDNINVDLSSNNNSSTNRFMKHVVTSSQGCSVNDNSDKSSNVDVLSKIFKEDINKSKSKSGLLIDQTQVDILSSSWRSQNPERISAYREEYKNCFPIHDDSVDFLNVPNLDDLVEVMLRQTHGMKAVKGWDNHRQLYNQPYKQIEKLGYQGQLGARMNIISIMYMQQALGSLVQSIETGNLDKSNICDSVKDIFAMSTKALDQAGRTGAFFHMIRRKATAQDTGLANLSDLRTKCQYLPLSEDGLFGKALETCLEKRKEQKDQLTELLPEYCPDKKRKADISKNNDYSAKKPKYQASEVVSKNVSVNQKSNFKSSVNSSSMKNRNVSNSNKDKGSYSGAKKDNKTNKGSAQSSWGSFRIPRKNDS